MTWADLIPIIAKYGLELGQYLWDLAAKKQDPTAEDWAKLNALRNDTARSQLLSALNRAGIPLTDPKAQALIDLLPK